MTSSFVDKVEDQVMISHLKLNDSKSKGVRKDTTTCHRLKGEEMNDVAMADALLVASRNHQRNKDACFPNVTPKKKRPSKPRSRRRSCGSKGKRSMRSRSRSKSQACKPSRSLKRRRTSKSQSSAGQCKPGKRSRSRKSGSSHRRSTSASAPGFPMKKRRQSKSKSRAVSSEADVCHSEEIRSKSRRRRSTSKKWRSRSRKQCHLGSNKKSRKSQSQQRKDKDYDPCRPKAICVNEGEYRKCLFPLRRRSGPPAAPEPCPICPPPEPETKC